MSDDVTGLNDELVRAYRLCFSGPAGQAVFVDLMKFCKFRVAIENQSDEGQRRVFLRIMSFLSFDREQLENLFRGHLNLKPGDSDDA